MRFLVSHPSAISGGADKFKPTKGKTYEQDQIEKAVQGTSRRGVRNDEPARPRASPQGGEANQKPGTPLPTVKSKSPYGENQKPLLRKARVIPMTQCHSYL